MAYAEGTQSRPAVDPDTIGTQSVYYTHDARSGGWDMVVETSARSPLEALGQAPWLTRPVADAHTLAMLDDARAVRMERHAKEADIAPGDPYVTLAKSPFVLADHSLQAPASPRLDYTSNVPHPPWHDLHASLEQRLPDASADRLMQFTAACYTHRIRAGDLSTIHLNEASLRITFAGSGGLAVPASVDLSQSPPHSQQSIEHMQQHDWQQAQMMSQIREQNAQTSQQGPMLAGP